MKWMYSDIEPRSMMNFMREAAQTAGFDTYNEKSKWLSINGGTSTFISLFAPYKGAELDRFFQGYKLNTRRIEDWFTYWFADIKKELPDIHIKVTARERPARGRRFAKGSKMYDVLLTIS